MAHVVEKKCPAGVCKNLIQIKINPDVCKSCGICAKVCPATCISGEKKVPYQIDQARCLKCGACIEKCPFKAISKEA
jgi:NADP-reducing hydrogenase subunit HndC